MSFQDLTGQRFGRLTVIERAGSDNHNNAVWRCKCDCGNNVTVRTYSLTSGNTTSCGCSRVKDLTGQRFGRWTVVEHAENNNGRAYWKCICDCGNVHIVSGDTLRSGSSMSCGCLHRELTKKRAATHGKSRTKLYSIWRGIKRRCLNNNDAFYVDYGGRGISVFPAWIDDFQAFYDYVSQLPHFGDKGYSLDRIDNNGNYEPDNLRWATASEQQRNSRQNRFVNLNGEKITVVEAAEKSGISESILRSRLKRGDTDSRLFRPVVRRPKS